MNMNCNIFKSRLFGGFTLCLTMDFVHYFFNISIHGKMNNDL